MSAQLARAVKAALTLLSLVFGPIVLTVLTFAVFFTITTMVYTLFVQRSPNSSVALAVRDVLGPLSTAQAVQNMNMGNVALAGVYVLVVTLIAVLDSALTTAVDALRQKAKLPLVDTVHHYNTNSYDIALARSSSATYPRMKQD